MPKSVGDILRDTWDKLLEDPRVVMTRVVVNYDDYTALRADPNGDRSIEYSVEGMKFRYLPVERRPGNFEPQIVTTEEPHA